MQQPGQAQRLVRRGRAVRASVPLREQQVDGRRDTVQPVRQLGGIRHPVRNVGSADLLLGPRQPLGHRLLGHEQRAPDLRGGQPAQRVQRQRDLCLDGQRRMAAGEHEAQLVVAQHLRRLVGWTGQGHRVGLLSRTGGLAAGDVDRAPARGERQPGPWLRWDTRARPGVQRPQDGVLHGVLGELQVARVPDERGQHAPALVAHEADEGGARGVVGHSNSITGRTSTAPCQAPGICAAVAIASSRSAHSSR